MAILDQHADSHDVREIKDDDPTLPHYDDGITTASIRFGKLNLICVVDPGLYQAWKEGTEKLKEQKPVKRSRAVEVMSALRSKYMSTAYRYEPPQDGEPF